jgi:dTDP-4-amino-4,6-dideoxygalactose transaminase
MERIRQVVLEQRFILGSEVRAFEAEFAAYLGVDHVVGVANGTDAITLILRGMGIGLGDEVVVPAFTFWASAEAVVPTGARPVFCDIDLETFCVTAETVRAALTPRTKAILAVDLFGNAIPIEELEEFGVPVIEDAAQAAGTTYRGRKAGSLGYAASFSFYPSKNLGCFGDGGAIATDDPDLAERIRLLRSHGSKTKVDYEMIGFNSRLDEIQAAILRELLPRLDGWADERRAAARHYRHAGLNSYAKEPVAVEGADPAWHLYVIRADDPDALSRQLEVAGIGYRAYYRTSIHLQPPMREFYDGRPLPATEAAARTNLAIPMGPGIGQVEAETVIKALSAKN